MGLFDQVGSTQYEEDLIYKEEQERQQREDRNYNRTSYTNSTPYTYRRSRTPKKKMSFLSRLFYVILIIALLIIFMGD